MIYSTVHGALALSFRSPICQAYPAPLMLTVACYVIASSVFLNLYVTLRARFDRLRLLNYHGLLIALGSFLTAFCSQLLLLLLQLV